jgi:hypothetical protein
MKGKICSILFAVVLVLSLSLVMAVPAAAQGGIFVTPTSGLVTTEAAGEPGPNTFIIVLTSAPTADVTIGFSSSDLTEGTVSPASVTFTSANWNAAQTVTVTGVNDDVDDGNIAYSIITAPAVSGDPNYSGLDAANVGVTNTDDDTAGITVTPTSGLVTTEALGTATFTIVLDSQPTADVTIGLSSSDLTEGTVSPASVTFTSANWNAAQTVTVTGVDDAVGDGNIAYSIITAPAVSDDPNYSGFVVDDVSVTNEDNDPSIIVTPTSGLVTTEAAGEPGPNTFTIVLNTQPTADVTIDLSSSDTTEGTVSPASVTFTSGNWGDTQEVTVTGVNDDVDDGNIAYSIITAPAVSGDPNYSGLDAANVGVTNTDDDTAGITVDPTSGLVTTEALDTATFTIVLNSEPTANVTIGLSSSDLTEGTVSPASVAFTSANWNDAQEVTVIGVDDAVVDGDVAYSIDGVSSSTDPLYNNVTFSVGVTNEDNDGGIIVTPTSGLVTTEAAGEPGPNTFTIVLNTQPTDDVTIDLSSSDTTEGTVSPASVTFTSGNWDDAQEVTVTGVNDDVDDGNIAYSIITAPAVSGDPNYSGLDAANVGVTNTDDDTAGITVDPTSGLVTTEALDTATFTIVLNSEPTANVTIGLSSSDLTEGTVSPASVTFTSANWNAAQTVTVTGVDDYVLDFNIAYTIITAAAVSDDPNYSDFVVDDVSVTNNDNEEASTIIIILTEIDKIEAKLDNTTYGLAAIKTAINGLGTDIGAIKAKTDTINWADITGLGTKIDDIEAKLDNTTYGLAAIKTAINGLGTDIGAIKAKTDTINWADITTIKTEVTSDEHGLAAIKEAIDAIATPPPPALKASAIDVSIARNVSREIVSAGAQAFWGQLTVQSTYAGYNIEVWDGDSWVPVVPVGGTAQSTQVSGFGLRILNDTYYTITVDYVFVYHSAP